jgi:hypothetical protein
MKKKKVVTGVFEKKSLSHQFAVKKVCFKDPRKNNSCLFGKSIAPPPTLRI